MGEGHVEDVRDRVVRHLRETGGTADELSLDDIAAIVGVSRSTLIRRIGSRRALDDALPGRSGGARRPAAERAVEAAAGLFAEHGVADVTMEAIADAAGCTVQAVHGQLGGRDGLLAAVFERYSPRPGLAAVLADPPADLRDAAEALYTEVLAAVLAEPPVLPALLAEVTARPGGALARHVRGSYGPRTAALVGGWLAGHRERGALRPLPDTTVLSLFVGPALARCIAAVGTGERPGDAERAAIAADLADAFARAVRP